MAFGSNLDVDGTAEQLTATATPFNYECWIKADPANSGNVHVGLASTVTAGTADATDGYILDAGEEMTIPVALADDVSDIYVIGSAANQKVYWMCY